MTPLPRPDALAVRPLASYATLPPEAAQTLFGAPLRGSERVDVVRAGRVACSVPALAGPGLRLVLDGLFDAPADALRLAGPVGSIAAPAPERTATRLVVPSGLVRAWGLGPVATVALGPVAVKAPVEAGADAGLEVDRALWIATGRPETARWLPQTDWPEPGLDALPTAATTDAGALVIARRVVTETDVRQARTRRRTIRLTPGQIVTPAAATLAREWNVFEA